MVKKMDEEEEGKDIHVCSQIAGCTPTSEYGHGGGLAGPVVTQESSDLTLVHVEVQTVHRYLPPLLSLLVASQQLYQQVLYHADTGY